MAFDDPALPRALFDRAGCYTTARVGGGRVHLTASHERRLRRDARALGLAEPDHASVRRAFESLALAEFGQNEGIVRLSLCLRDFGATSLIGVPRPLGPEPGSGEAVTAPFAHPGPSIPLGAKRYPVDALERARQLARETNADEVILFDAEGRLVEGAVSNLLVVDSIGALWTPDPALGAVAGIAIERVCSRHPEANTAEIDLDQIHGASELIALNAVRGARPILTLDGRPVGEGRPGPWATRLQRVFDESDPGRTS